MQNLPTCLCERKIMPVQISIALCNFQRTSSPPPLKFMYSWLLFLFFCKYLRRLPFAQYSTTTYSGPEMFRRELGVTRCRFRPFYDNLMASITYAPWRAHILAIHFPGIWRFKRRTFGLIAYIVNRSFDSIAVCYPVLVTGYGLLYLHSSSMHPPSRLTTLGWWGIW